MIRHIFIATFKDNITDDVKQKELSDLKVIKDKIPGVIELEVGFSKGWVGAENQIVMTVDFETKTAFEGYLEHPYHADYINQTGTDYFDVSSFVIAQFEY